MQHAYSAYIGRIGSAQSTQYSKQALCFFIITQSLILLLGSRGLIERLRVRVLGQQEF